MLCHGLLKETWDGHEGWLQPTTKKGDWHNKMEDIFNKMEDGEIKPIMITRKMMIGRKDHKIGKSFVKKFISVFKKS